MSLSIITVAKVHADQFFNVYVACDHFEYGSSIALIFRLSSKFKGDGMKMKLKAETGKLAIKQKKFARIKSKPNHNFGDTIGI